MTEGERRLAAIMFTDMVGFTTMGQSNEALSLALVEEQRKLVRPILAVNNGREVKTIGDAFLAEFPSALMAVRAACEIQKAAKERNASSPPERSFLLRVGVHLGDVVESGGDIVGDAVNVASRIEPLAEAGGICITRQVYDHVRNKLDFPLTSIGERSLKNVGEPVEVFKVVLPWKESGPVRSHSEEPDQRRIAVLPLLNLSPDVQDEYFADGMVEELIGAISKVKDVEVISRTSTMQYRGSGKKTADVSRELNAGTIIEGSVRKAGNRVRISLNMIDAKRDKNVWAESYDRELRDVFEIQSDVAQKVAMMLKTKLGSERQVQIERRAQSNEEAYTLYLRGLSHLSKASREGARRALGFFDKAISLDRDYAVAIAGLADCYTLLGDEDFKPAEAYPKAKELALKALRLDPALAEAHCSLGLVLWQFYWDWDKAEAEFQSAIGLNPSYSLAHSWYSWFLNAKGDLDRCVLEAQKAIDLNPLLPDAIQWLGQMLAIGRSYDRAIEVNNEVVDMDPNNLNAHYNLALAYTESRRYDEAKKESEKLITLSGGEMGRYQLAKVYVRTGKTVEARKLFDEELKQAKEEYGNPEAVRPATWAWWYKMLGEDDRASELLEDAFREHSGWLSIARVHPYWDDFRSDPRFASMLKEVGP
ncbi:MAG TPA: adenylate/guanylate cyclase domain-containing protein [Nitrososphaerales archaeon]|nr:adenylate/guanylate cyclase domain-containing protein [Nitrososphaerales archaeon]